MPCRRRGGQPDAGPEAAHADNKAAVIDEMAAYLDFVDYGGGVIFAEQIPKEEWARILVIDARDAAQYAKGTSPGRSTWTGARCWHAAAKSPGSHGADLLQYRLPVGAGGLCAAGGGLGQTCAAQGGMGGVEGQGRIRRCRQGRSARAPTDGSVCMLQSVGVEGWCGAG